MESKYTISEIRRAGKIGEISDIYVEHLISLLDEAVRFEEGMVKSDKPKSEWVNTEMFRNQIPGA